ncbi:hypothetical protein ACTFIY_010518 [Dictyostelium cf. discoideum]
MGKRKPIPSINTGKNLNKKLKFSQQDPEPQQQQQQQPQPQSQPQPIRKYKSRREKEIHQMIDKIKSERMFIYKNAERHLKLGLVYIELASSLPAVLKDLHTALKKLDELESSLIAELESLKIPVRISSATAVLTPPIDHVNTSIAITDAASINNNDNTTTTTTTTTTINNDNFASTTNTLPVNSVTRTTATLLEVNNLITATLRPTTSTTATIGTSATTDDTTAIDSTNTIATTDAAISTSTTENTIKKKGRPLLKEVPENCYVCGVTETPYWRKGTDDGEAIDLCNACGLYYMKLEKKERLLKQNNITNNVLK